MAWALLRPLAMNVTLYQAAAAMNANSRWQDLIAQNMASSSVPGYKRQDLAFSAFPTGPMPSAGLPLASLQFTLPQTEHVTNFQTGELKFTGVKTHVAIDGPGFFEVQLANGATAFTRDGEFKISPQGQLINKDGHLVLTDSGPIQLDPNNPGPITISPTGEITQGSDLKGVLSLVDFSDTGLLTSIGGGYFLNQNPNLTADRVEAPHLRQEYLEGANTSAVLEMSHLITAMRMYEANQRMIQLEDQRMGNAIRDLAGTN